MGQVDSKSRAGDSPLAEFFNETCRFAMSLKQMVSLSWDEFERMIEDINKKSYDLRSLSENMLVFAIKKGTTENMFWKATVSILCLKLNSTTEKLISTKSLTLREFMRIRAYLNDLLDQQISLDTIFPQSACSRSQSPKFNFAPDNASNNITNEEIAEECSICLERPKEVALPCFHGFCLLCIDQWSEFHMQCPICRNSIECINDVWIIAGYPNRDEMVKNLNEFINST